MRAPRPFLDAPAPAPDRRHDARDEGVPQTRARRIGRGIAIGLCAVACVLALSLHMEQVSAANLAVTNCLDDGSAGSLRVVIGAAGSGDIIGFNQDCTGAGAITLGSTLTLTRNVTIDGVGHSVTVQAAATPNTATYRVFTINSGVVSISNLTIANGHTVGGLGQEGGGIQNNGTLTVTSSTLSGNRAFRPGGGIYNASGSTLTVTNSTLSSNFAVLGGGGIENFGMLTVTSSTLSGNNVSTGLAASGGGIENFGMLTVTSSTLSGNSATFGGGIANEGGGTMMVTSSTFSGNSATDGPGFSGEGGGIENFGMLTVTNTTLSGNSATFGGAISNDSSINLSTGIATNGTLTMTNNTLSGNSAVVGGGLYNNGNTATVTSSTFSGNSATDGPGFSGEGGGGICNVASLPGGGVSLAVSNSTFTDNRATGRSGGGIYNLSGTMTVTSSTLARNSTSGFDGGGLYNFNGTLTVTNSTLSGNSASGGGGIASSGGTVTMTNSTLSGNSTTNGNGGGIFNGGTLTVTNSTFSGNSGNISGLGSTGGGIENDGTLAVTNSTFSGNSATGGGGIENYGGTLTVTNSTLAGNSVGSFGGGGIANSNGGTVNLTNTIIATNTAPTSPDISGAVVSQGHNLIGNTTGGSGFVASDLQNVNPLLDTLKDNGGTTPLPDGSHVMTRALLAGSPAIGAGDSSVCNSTTAPPGAPVAGKDERGFPRPATTCAIGAFEQQVATVTIILSPATLPNGAVGVAYSQTITASGGSGTGYSFALTAGTLPTGLTLTTAGLLSGTPSAAGAAIFTVTATDSALNSGSQQYTLTIAAAAGPTLRSIALTGPNSTPPPAALKVGQRVQLTATGTYSDGSTANITTQVQWSSSNPPIVKVDATGIVTGQSPGGPVTLTATLNGVSGTTTVSVTPPTPLGIQPAPAPAARPSGATAPPAGAAGAPALTAPAPLPPGR